MAQIVEQISDALQGLRTRSFLSDNIQDVLFDVTIEDSEEDINEVTRHAIEDGNDITDHVIEIPKRLSVRAVFSDDVLDLLDPTTFFNASIEDRLEILNRWVGQKQILTYYGHETDLINVVIESLVKSKNQDVGEGVEIDIALVKVNLVSPEQVEIEVKPKLKKKGQTPSQTQSTAGNTSSAALANKSWLSSLFGS